MISTPLVADERTTIDAVLAAQRAEIAALLDGLDDHQARTRLVPSLTTPLGLVKHAAFVERVWFHARIAGRSRAEVGLPETIDESFLLADEDTIESVRADYLSAATRSAEIAAEHDDLDEQFDWRGRPVSLRWILHHVIAELARHAGHGDILVEQLTASRPSGSDHPSPAR